jgi:tetratricopeptide (TPR) repeat protein
MENKLHFNFQVPPAPSGPVVELTASEAEKMLLKQLEAAAGDPRSALWQLAQFYKMNGQHEKALLRLRELMALLPDPEQKADCVFTMGQGMEKVGDYPNAIRYYREALALEPAGTFTWYFIHNNLGYSLNTLGQFSDGEDYCRRAIVIDPTRSSAYKNLGIALSGHGRFPEAARAYVAATQVNAADSRAFYLLQNLVQHHPELEYEFRDSTDFCRKAVEIAAKKLAGSQPKVYRGWRKQWLLLKCRIKRFLHRGPNDMKQHART